MSTRDEYVAKMKHQLDEWNAEIDSLEAKVRQAKEDAKAKYREQVKESETKLETLKAATEESWETLKREVEHSWESLKSAVNQFKAHFKEGGGEPSQGSTSPEHSSPRAGGDKT
jgi:septal ring factor EnvC (AmiA/AmiB activator)